MRTGDGLLARLRVPERQLLPRQLRDIAALAQRFGNGQLEITARGNLQVRGLADQTAPLLAQAVDSILPTETGLVVETPPLAGLDPTELADPRPLAAALRQQAIAFEHQLGPKVTVVVDGGGHWGLALVSADLRLRATTENSWRFSLGSTERAELSTANALATTLEALRLLATQGPTARGRDLDAAALRLPMAAALPLTPAPTAAATIVPLRTGAALRIALPFGSMGSTAFGDLADAAEQHAISEFLLAPGHALFALGAEPALLAWRTQAARLGFLVDLDDPRLHLHACIGSDGCTSGHGPSRSLATELLHSQPALFDGSWTLHLSGCAKGCAHPRPSDLALVGEPGGWAVIRGGRAGDAPLAHLHPTELAPAFARPAALVAAVRQTGQTSAAVLGQLPAPVLAAALKGQSQ